MVKWIVFAVVSTGWAAVCWFFASMVALTHASPAAVRAQDECARALIAVAAREGRALDMMDARFDPACRERHRAVLNAGAWPYQRTGLLIAFVPVLLVGGLIYWRSRA